MARWLKPKDLAAPVQILRVSEVRTLDSEEAGDRNYRAGKSRCTESSARISASSDPDPRSLDAQ